jgi:hypothetical protein
LLHRCTIKASVNDMKQGAIDLMKSAVPKKLRSSAASKDKEVRPVCRQQHPHCDGTSAAVLAMAPIKLK